MPVRLLSAICPSAIVCLLCVFSLAAGNAGKPIPQTIPSPTPLLPAPATQPAPIPDAAAQAKAEKTIKEVFRNDYASGALADRQALARKLLQQAGETRDDPAGRYVLLRESRDIAASAGDVPTAARAIRRLCQLHAVDPAATTLASMTVASQAAGAPQTFADISRLCRPAVDQAVRRGDYPSAWRLCYLAETAGEKGADLALVSLAQARAKDLQVTFIEFQRAQSARGVLQQAPDDGDANLMVGRFLCFINDNWPEGLAHLCKSSDPSLRALAQAELAGAAEPPRLLDLGNRWWDAAQARGGLARRHLVAHAASFYRQALPALSGLNRTAALKRIEADDFLFIEDLNLRPGLVADLYKGISFSQKTRSRIDPQVDFDWSQDAPDQFLPKDNFSIRWRGFLRPPLPGRYDLIVIANMGARIWIDDALVLDDPDLSRHRNGVRVGLDLAGPLHSLRIDYWDRTGVARMKVHWVPPGAEKPEAVPASALCHESFGAPVPQR